MSMRAKFMVQSITKSQHWNPGSDEHLFEIKMIPVCGGSEENDAFYEASPAGAITLATINQAAAEGFVIGAEYYVDFTQA